MANATVVRTGQINQAGAVDAIFLKVYGGEVITSFQEKNVAMDKHFVRTITSGKSASFPVFGKKVADLPLVTGTRTPRRWSPT